MVRHAHAPLHPITPAMLTRVLARRVRVAAVTRALDTVVKAAARVLRWDGWVGWLRREALATAVAETALCTAGARTSAIQIRIQFAVLAGRRLPLAPPHCPVAGGR